MSRSKSMQNTTSIIALIFICIAFIRINAAQKYPFKADFSIKTVAFKWAELPCIGINLINNDPKVYDSLQIRLYFNATHEEMGISGNPDDTMFQLGARLDIAILYDVQGFQSGTETDELRQKIMNTSLIKLPEVFDSTTGKYGWCFPLDLGNTVIRTSARLRLDLIWDSRSPLPPYQDLMNQAPRHIPGADDWSWGSKRRVDGFPANFEGIPELDREAVDTATQLQLNPYIAVFRKDELLWGLPPDWKAYYGNSFDSLPHPPREPMPYDPIAVPFDEYADQLQRDSANCAISRFRVNQAGYRPGDKHYFYYVGSATPVKIINVDDNSTAVTNVTLASTGLEVSSQIKMAGYHNALLFTGGSEHYKLESPVVSGNLFEGLLPQLPDGRYRIISDSDTSAPFVIRKDVYNMVKDAMLKFYGANRCGNSKSWFHEPCHLNDPVTGGWHDRGDHLKEGATIGYTASVLGLAAAVFQDRDQDLFDADHSHTQTTDGIPDILYEAKHGADFILQSYEKAGENVAEMITSVGDFGADHSWWGLPEVQDYMPQDRGGPPRPARNEVTSDYLGNYAANLAFVSKLFESYNNVYSAKCIEAAKKIYAFTKDRKDVASTEAYPGSITYSDDLAFACLALLWATGERQYLNDLCIDTAIGEMASTDFPKAAFEGGWFAHHDPIFFNGLANTGWANTHAHVLWGFYRLILDDEVFCDSLGLSQEQRLGLIEKTVYTLITNLPSGSGTQQIELPDGGTWIESNVKYELPWFNMFTESDWGWNFFQAGNIAQMYYYYDITSRIKDLELPSTPASTDWKTEEMKTILVRMLDYMLGVNAWDVSMINGIGFKNFNHPHHRAANPELRNSAIEYNYRSPVGALIGGNDPTTEIYNDDVNEYFYSDVGIEGVTTLLMPVCGLSCTDRIVKTRFDRVKTRTAVQDVCLKQIRQGVFLVSSNKPITSFKVFSLSGRLVSGREFKDPEKSTFTIGIDGLRGSGCYVMRIAFGDGGSYTRKLTLTRH